MRFLRRAATRSAQGRTTQTGSDSPGTHSRTRRGRLLLPSLLLIGSALIFAATSAAVIDSNGGAPSIQSEFTDYNPGQTVNLTGSGWDTGGSTVHIVVNDAIGQSWQHTADVT